jgi:signal transduction histidine kinase
MKKISVKLALFFIALICISSILSFLVSILFTNGISSEIKQNQEAIAMSMRDLNQKTDVSLDEIIGIASNSMYDIRKVKDIESLEVSAEELNRVHNQEIVSLSRFRFHGSATMLMIDNSYILIRLYPNNTIFKIVGSRVWFTLLSLIMIGALLIALFVKRVVDPILKLNWATQEVAKGNFDLQLDYQSDDEVGQLTENFNKMTRELKSIEYLRKDFVTNVSHEFKTPIASIQGFAKLLQKGNLSAEEKQEYTGIIVEETTRLSNLSSNILKMSKLENQEIVEKKNEFSLDEQIRKSILLLEHEWSKKNIELDIELDKVDYLGDEELLEQVWLNILGNAIKFSPANSQIAIRLGQTPSAIQVKITDYGPGMNEETRSRIFEKFYQGDKNHSYEGSGLGLSLVKRILDLYGGKIHVESILHEGSTFTVELPL